MKGNQKIGITAEFVAIIKSKENSDYLLFVSTKTKRLFIVFNFIFRGVLSNIFQSRLELSSCMKRLIYSEKPRNIFNLGAGFSLDGFNSKNVNYYDLDFPKVINLKKFFLEKICSSKGRISSRRYHLIESDLLKDYFVKKKGKSVFFAEGVASYLNQEEFHKFIQNIFRNMKSKDVFIYNERRSKERSLSYGILRGFMSLLSRSKSYTHFTSEENAKNYFLDFGFSQVVFLEKRGFNILKLVK